MAELDYISALLQLFLEFRRDQLFRLPEYTPLGQTGTANMPTHTILLTAMWRGRELRVQRSARSKQDAKREVAKAALEMILDTDPGAVIPDVPQAPESAATHPSSNDFAKNELQEFVQRRPGNPLPTYKLVSTSGSQHQPEFCVRVTVMWNGKILEELGKGGTKKAAGNCAAERMLQRLNGRSPSPIVTSSAEQTIGVDYISDDDDVGYDEEQEGGALDSAKNRLQEALQARGCRLPSYTLKHRAGRTIHTEEASASQLQRANKLCAYRALPTVLNLLDNITDEELDMQPCTPPSTSAAQNFSASSSEIAIDENQLARLHIYTSHMPHILFDTESSGNSVLCLISVQTQDGSYMLTQGEGSTKPSATHCAMESLLQNLQQKL
ncbi:hypothetical protein EMCRGX_G021753 [Ephydatia muelleri]